MLKNLFPSRPEKTTILKPGSYLVELATIRPGSKKDFGDGSPPRDRLTFCFKTTKTGEPANRTFTASTDPRSSLMAFVKQMAGHNIPNEGELRDGEKFTAFLESFIGKRFKASIVPSRDGRFNNIVSISSSSSEQEAA